MTFTLKDFITESNKIEGILRPPTLEEIEAHERLLSLSSLSVSDVAQFVWVIAKAPIRNRKGMDVVVGQHVPPLGGPEIEQQLIKILQSQKNAFHQHHEYETLHPFMDGNGRSGRAIWLWKIGGIHYAPLGFLHHWYYQSLSHNRR